jgi:phosphatidylserine/phosphatidylglycerophosphate/cardiolipin synthase-like enzyme
MTSPRGAVLALVALAVMTGCGAAPAAVATSTPALATPSPSPSPIRATPRASAVAAPLPSLSLLIEPAAGMGEIYSLIASARHTVDLTMYELEDTEAEEALAADAERGVDVRVILNSSYTRSDNDAAFAYLEAHSVHVHWASSRYALTHQKTLVIDTTVSVVMTLNWTSRYYDDTRDVAVIDRTPDDIAAIQATFNADYDGAAITPPGGADLIWSPTTALDGLLGLIDGATRSLYVENEEMDNSDITDALVAAARRGVDVVVCMTNSSSWTSAFRELVDAGVHLRVYSPDAALYIHAKVLVRDPGSSDQEAFAGSQNFSTESLRYNRELGVEIRSSTLIGQLAAMIKGDYDGASAWSS